MRKQIYSTEDRIAHAEESKLEWRKCAWYLIVIVSMAYLLFGCNIGLRSTSCPSHNNKFFYNGHQPKWYKH